MKTFLLIDKPKGMTSHDVVDQVRKITGEKRVGHGGTLDPNATGLLIVGVGREATKQLGEISMETTKTYLAEIFLGEERDTDDIEGIVISKAKGVLPPGKGEIRRALSDFLGDQQQVPPAYSAIKMKGKKAYEMARRGEKVKLKARNVVIYHIKCIAYSFPVLSIEVEVSSGTYIRALARDIGKRLGCGAYLRELRRTKVGKYDIANAKTLGKITSSIST